MISIVDYGVSNLGSIRNMLRKLGLDSEVASDPEQVAAAKKLILPGVGAFDHGAIALHERGLMEPLRFQALERKVPLLGICLGMQLLGKGSEEGVLGGLGLIDGFCTRFRLPEGSALRVPHMGWNEPLVRRHGTLVEGLEPRARFYFTHSYHLVCKDATDVVAVANHGVEFTAIIQRENVMGVQFHPEKSHRYGMTLLRNFGMV